MKIECSQCGQDISRYFASADMGMCSICGYLFCKKCISKKCPTCNEKLVITKRVTEYPAGWGPKHVIAPEIAKKMKKAKVPCSQCGRDIADFFSKADMGMCNVCRKVYCKYCISALHKKCTSCNEKMIITGRITEFPSEWTQPQNQTIIQPVIQPVIQPIIQTQPQFQQVKYCQTCGKPLNASANFCDGCGSRN